MSVTGFNRRRRETAKAEAVEHGKEKEQRQSKTGAAEGQALKEKSFPELRVAAKEAGIEGYGKLNKDQLIEALKAVK